MKRRTMAAFALSLSLLVAGQAGATVIPAQGINAGWQEFTVQEAQRAVVLCESLSVCDERGGKVIDTLRFGDGFLTSDGWDGWADCTYADGSKTGWVRSDYILVDPAYYLTDAQTAVYAYDDPMAPRVALVDGGIRLPIIAEKGEWYVVSLRGASGWIRKTPADTAGQTTFKPDMLAGLTQATLTMDGEHVTLLSEEKLRQLSAMLTSVEDTGGPVAGCPFGATLALTLSGDPSAQIILQLATDSCCVYRVDGRDYRYTRGMGSAGSSPKNSLLFDLFR